MQRKHWCTEIMETLQTNESRLGQILKPFPGIKIRYPRTVTRPATFQEVLIHRFSQLRQTLHVWF